MGNMRGSVGSGKNADLGRLVITGLGAALGAGIGAIVSGGNPLAIQKGFAWGAQAGGLLGRLIIKNPAEEWPNLADLRTQLAAYGTPRPIVYGTMRLAGNIIWTNEIRVEMPGSGRGVGGQSRGQRDREGKGGDRRSNGSNSGWQGIGGEDTQDAQLYASFAIAYCEGPVDAIKRIWADGILIYDAASYGRFQTPSFTGSWTIYLGTEAQDIDPLMEGIEGVGTVCAYRGTCYIVFEEMNLTEFGGNIPTITAEICSNSASQYAKNSVTVSVGGVGSDNFYISKREPFIYALNGSTLSKIDRNSLTVVDYADVTDLVLYAPEDPDDPTSALIADTDVVNPGSKIIVDQGNDSIYIGFYTGANESFLVRFNSFLIPFGYNFLTRKAASTKEYEGIVLGYSTGDFQKIYTAVWNDSSLTGYYVPVQTNGRTFITIFTSSGPAAKGISGTWRPGNFVQDPRGYIWYISYDNAANDRFVLTRFDAAGHVDSYEYVGTLYRCKSVIYSSYDDTLICFGGEGRVVKVNASVYPNTPTVDSSSANTADVCAASQRANALSNLRITGNAIWMIHTSGGASKARKVNLTTFALVEDYNATLWGLASTDFVGCGYEPESNALWMSATATSKFYQVLVQRITGTAPLLGDVIEDIFERAGLIPAEYDTVALATLTDSITGYAISRMLPAKTALEPLLTRYFCDLAEIDGKLQVVQRTGEPLSGLDLRMFNSADENDDFVISADIGFASTGVGVGEIYGDGTLGLDTTFAIGDLILVSGAPDGENNGFMIVSDIPGVDTIEVTDMPNGDLLTAAPGVPLVTVRTWRVFPIPTSDLGVFEGGAGGGSAPSKIIETHASEHELPRRVLVSHISEARDYETSTQIYTRTKMTSYNTTGSRRELSVDFPLVMTSSEAKTLAKKISATMWINRFQYELFMGPKWMLLAPTDVVQLEVNSSTHTLRLVNKSEGANYVSQNSLVLEDVESYAMTASGLDPTFNPTVTIPALAPSFVDNLDIHIIHGIDDNPGWYSLAAPASTGTWQGAVVYRSNSDDRQQPIIGIGQASVYGVVLSDITDTSPINSFDESLVIKVKILYGTISSTTEALVLDGANLAVCGDEILQFKTVTLVSGSTYELTGLLRYRFGTKPLAANHRRGERFALLEAGKIRRVPSTTAELGILRSLRGVTPGHMVEQGARTEFTNTGKGLKPYAPAPYPGYWFYDAAKKNIHLAFMRCPRYSGEWRDYVDVPQVEMEELYEADVYLASDDSFIRTISGSNPNMAGAELFAVDGGLAYLDDEQIADLGHVAASEEIYFKIYQVSPLVGRGYPLTVTFIKNPT
jgi:hypothetical protein